jgi:anti-sigma factor RsiW
VEAYFDGEVDSPAAFAIETHVENCADCAALLADLQQMRSALRREAPYHRAPPQLRARIAAGFKPKHERRMRMPAWRLSFGGAFGAGLGSGVIAASMVAGVSLFLLQPSASDALTRDLVNAHLRALVSDRQIDVASSDHHTVKPWFEGRGDVSPPVADFPAEDYRLVGGRADYVNGVRASVLVYRHRAHMINVFAWADRGDALPLLATRNGYTVSCWRAGTLAFCAVSDTSRTELERLVTLIKAERE